MNTKNLANKLISGACGLGLCDKGQSDLMSAKGKSDMVTAFWHGIDFCLARNYPNLTTLKHFFLPELRDQHIYIDESVSLVNEKRAVFLGDCTAEFITGEYKVSRLYVKHGSRLKVIASGHAYVMIDALDNARIDVEVSDEARVIINVYAKATVTGERVKVIRKNKETYEL